MIFITLLYTSKKLKLLLFVFIRKILCGSIENNKITNFVQFVITVCVLNLYNICLYIFTQIINHKVGAFHYHKHNRQIPLRFIKTQDSLITQTFINIKAGALSVLKDPGQIVFKASLQKKNNKSKINIFIFTNIKSIYLPLADTTHPYEIQRDLYM